MPKNAPRPHRWISGPDPIDHELYRAYGRSRAQAHFRREQWDLTWPDFQLLWRIDNRYLLKGRTLGSICMTRLDTDLPWSMTNVEFITRKEHFSKCGGVHA